MSSSPESKYTITPMWLLTHNTHFLSHLFRFCFPSCVRFTTSWGSRIADYLNDLNARLAHICLMNTPELKEQRCKRVCEFLQGEQPAAVLVTPIWLHI